jgi:excinuclease ABC subunit C
MDKELLKQIPQRPGVYMMLDSQANIIYVGKAKNLKIRVTQYFRNQKDRDLKVVEMIHNINAIEYIVTDTELDALIEECRLIKEIKPRYNRQMKEQKCTYIKIPFEPYPKVTAVTKKVDDSAFYFGPFTSPHRVEITVQFLNDFYPLRKCPTTGLMKSSSGCLFKQLGKCLGVCTGRVSSNEYTVHIEKIRQLLNGKDPSVFQELSQMLDKAIVNLEFEKAAQYRDYYSGLRYVIGKQHLIQVSSKYRNILAVEFIDTLHAKLFFIKGNMLLHREVLKTETIIDNKDSGLYLKEIINDKFQSNKCSNSRLTQKDIDEAQIIYSYLKRNRNNLISFWIPASRLKGDKLDRTIAEITNRITLGMGGPSISN